MMARPGVGVGRAVAVGAAAVLWAGAAAGQGETSRVRVYPPEARPSVSVTPNSGSLAQPAARRELARRRARRAARLHLAPDARSSVLRELRRRGAAVEVRMHLGRGTPRQLRGRPLEAATPGAESERLRDERTARKLLRRARGILGLRNPDAELRLARVARDRRGARHLRFQQRYAGLPVWPGGLIVHLDPAGHAVAVTASSIATPDTLAPTPDLAADTAVRRARRAVPGGATARPGAPELIVHVSDAGAAALAWSLDLEVALDAYWRVVVDARSGAILRAYNRVMTDAVAGSGLDLFGTPRNLSVWENPDGMGGFTYQAVDASKSMFNPGPADPPDWTQQAGFIRIVDALNQAPPAAPPGLPTLFDIVNPAPTGWTPPDAVSAAFGLSEVYDYYFDRFARESFDGFGSNMFGIVRLAMNNAFWHPGLNVMAFGNAAPFAGALDVVGHEVTHGVIQETANLVYQNQPGAANEAFADIFGEMVETRTSGGPDWLVGAQLGAPLRSLADPSSLEICCGRPYPERMSEFIAPTDPFLLMFPDGDNGGVHMNSTILGHAFYLAAAGLPNAIGTADAEQIFFDALANRLTSASQFLDVRLAAVAAADALFGAVSPQAQAIADAFDAVEIFDGGSIEEPPDQDPVAGPDSTMFLRSVLGPLALARQETALGDGPGGVAIVPTEPVVLGRPSVTGDGSEVWYVEPTFNDPCMIETDTTLGVSKFCLISDPFGGVASVAVSPDGAFLALTPLADTVNAPLNSIVVVDLTTFFFDVFVLEAPVLEGGSIPTILFADVMDFSLDGDTIMFDALNQLTLPSGALVLPWSMYALDRGTSLLSVIVPPFEDVDTGFPSLAQTSDAFLTFDVTDPPTGDSIVLAANLVTGLATTIGLVPGGPGIPGYTGDDSAIVFSTPNGAVATGASLIQQPVGADRITPVGGATTWLDDADFGAVYRRGPFSPPLPDADNDGEPDVTDNCPHEPNPGQVDTVGDGTGDACRCGDVDDDGVLSAADVTAARNERAGLPPGITALDKCSVIGALECDIADVAVLIRTLGGEAPAPLQVCSAAVF